MEECCNTLLVSLSESRHWKSGNRGTYIQTLRLVYSQNTSVVSLVQLCSVMAQVWEGFHSSQSVN